MPAPHPAQAESVDELPPGCLAPADGDGIAMVVKGRMHALRVAQIVRVVPASLRARIFRRPEPEGNQPLRAGGGKFKEQVA